MRDPRPLSERFDLGYVHRRLWPHNAVRWLSVLLVVPATLYLATMLIVGDQRVYSSGPLTHAHAMFENDCAKCHQADAHRSGYWLPTTDAACLSCHDAGTHPDPHAGLFAGSAAAAGSGLTPMVMSGQCAACHVEHRGRDVDLTRIADTHCVQCHGNLEQYYRSIPGRSSGNAGVSAGQSASPAASAAPAPVAAPADGGGQ